MQAIAMAAKGDVQITVLSMSMRGKPQWQQPSGMLEKLGW